MSETGDGKVSGAGIVLATLASGQFLMTLDSSVALDDAGVDPTTSDAIIDENAEARLNGLRASLSVLAIIALVALVFTRRIPTTQPGAVAVGAVQ